MNHSITNPQSFPLWHLWQILRSALMASWVHLLLFFLVRIARILTAFITVSKSSVILAFCAVSSFESRTSLKRTIRVYGVFNWPLLAWTIVGGHTIPSWWAFFFSFIGRSLVEVSITHVGHVSSVTVRFVILIPCFDASLVWYRYLLPDPTVVAGEA